MIHNWGGATSENDGHTYRHTAVWTASLLSVGKATITVDAKKQKQKQCSIMNTPGETQPLFTRNLPYNRATSSSCASEVSRHTHTHTHTHTHIGTILE